MEVKCFGYVKQISFGCVYLKCKKVNYISVALYIVTDGFISYIVYSTSTTGMAHLKTV